MLHKALIGTVIQFPKFASLDFCQLCVERGFCSTPFSVLGIVSLYNVSHSGGCIVALI